ncbi:MAG: DUF3798 domain-containing protein [Spirochaetales bacterium]|nr:DUF3798 domain-containing protein [Spirochaetales bacterium]MBQ9809960.1 DUF3798 domain-containing protein [Spirochaetales bacterium]
MKKLSLVLLMAALVLGSVFAAGRQEAAQAASSNWKIAVVTSTVTQGEEPYRAGEMAVEQYGKEHIVHVTYPDNFTTEQEVALSTLLSLAADDEVKAIIVSGAPAGFAAMFDKVKEQRPDMLIWAGSPSDALTVASASADICFDIDIVQQGVQLADATKKMGCNTLVHYSFPRHMGVEKLLNRRNAMEARCKELGITFVDGTTPDPTSDAGATGVQQFVLEDVPKMISKYGAGTAFFGTNQAQVEPMIKTALENGGYFLMPNDPSPFIGYANALGISIPNEHQGDAVYMAEQISKVLAERGLTGHAGNWNVSLQMLNIQVGCVYAKMYIEGQTNGLFDKDAFKKAMVEVAGEGVSINNAVSDGKALDNYMLILADYSTY